VDHEAERRHREHHGADGDGNPAQLVVGRWVVGRWVVVAVPMSQCS
jgi:hypothetical protein